MLIIVIFNSNEYRDATANNHLTLSIIYCAISVVCIITHILLFYYLHSYFVSLCSFHTVIMKLKLYLCSVQFSELCMSKVQLLQLYINDCDDDVFYKYKTATVELWTCKVMETGLDTNMTSVWLQEYGNCKQDDMTFTTLDNMVFMREQSNLNTKNSDLLFSDNSFSFW